VFTIWEDLITDPVNFATDELFNEEFQKNLIKQKRRDKLFIQSLTNQKIARSPYPSEHRSAVYDIYKERSGYFKCLSVYLVENGTHTIIKNCIIHKCKDHSDVMKFVMNDDQHTEYFEYKI